MRTLPDHDLIFHDDQGTQYTSRTFQKALERPGITQSISRPGNLHDNAVVEFFFKTLKRELIKGQAYEDQEETKQEIFKYIEFYYNTKRMHSTLGYMSPRDFERQSA
ncbi:MAG: IS3 family transposase [Atopobium sp.]|nr:IS3 family transposase [Atopobium sp.]